MPLYEYQCKACGDTFEVNQRMTEEPIRDCPACGTEGSVVRLVSAGSGLIFKGSGFYITDYKNKSNDNGTGTNGNGSSSEGKTSSAPKKEESNSTESTTSSSSTSSPSSSEKK